MPSPFSLLIKPVSWDCNLRCGYCFYTCKSELFGKGRHIMPMSLLEKLCQEYLSIPMETHLFCWQGGEPTLAGLPFYRQAVEYMKLYGGKGVNVANALQTNGTLLNDEWGEFLAEYSFLVGISIDGPPRIHDHFRKDMQGNGSYHRATSGLKTLMRHGVPVNALTVVNGHSANHPLEIYRHLRDDLGIQYHQYIEETITTAPVTADQWGDFLIAIFDEWVAHDQGRVSVRLFDSIMRIMETGQADSCAMGRSCNQYLVIEHDGGIYPCDFHVLPEWRLGNLGESPLDAVRESPLAQRFASRKLPPKECQNCRFLQYCAADCPRNRCPATKSRLCKGWQRFFSHCLGR